ncbi:hypothetical protein [Chryseobacterium sp.]|uniref:hypothetical protein n=1 Tax=Chryseobacterium sp. TaxID=1871047 RepID=UPI00289DDE3E|nr:hypothetical protein [Chryseobacterium sp.]
MKNIIALAVSLFSLTIFAQVGINNNTPKATLDITAQTINGSKPEGLLPPRLTGDQIQAGDAQYTAAQAGIIIYATAAATAPSTKTANITAPGYYFYDGTAWQKLTSGAAVADATTTAKGIVQLAGDLSGTAASPVIAANAVTSAKIVDGTVANTDLATGTGGIYKSSGSLSGNTTVTQGANTLAFTSTATNGFSVDGTTLSVDAANDRVGVGTTSPTTTLDVNGNVRIGTAVSSAGGTGVATLVRDNTTGEVKVVSSSSGNTANITYVRYVLSNVNQDWVSNFNTNIPTSQYTVVVVGSSFSLTSISSGGSGIYNPLILQAYQSGGTWRLEADYLGGTTTSNGTWTIYCLVINNSIVKTLPDVTANLGGLNSGSASIPSGL